MILLPYKKIKMLPADANGHLVTMTQIAFSIFATPQRMQLVVFVVLSHTKIDFKLTWMTTKKVRGGSPDYFL